MIMKTLPNYDMWDNYPCITTRFILIDGWKRGKSSVQSTGFLLRLLLEHHGQRLKTLICSGSVYHTAFKATLIEKSKFMTKLVTDLYFKAYHCTC